MERKKMERKEEPASYGGPGTPFSLFPNLRVSLGLPPPPPPPPPPFSPPSLPVPCLYLSPSLFISSRKKLTLPSSTLPRYCRSR